MYSREDRAWRSDCTDEELLRWSRETVNTGNPEARFLLASDLLSKHNKGSEAAEAVHLMEQTAQQKYPPAVFAMGQMFQWGWAVHKDTRRATELYRQAAALGYEPAVRLLAEAKRKKVISIVSACAAALVCVLAAVGIFRWVQQMDPRTVIRVHRGTQLVQPATTAEYGDEFRALIAAYDDELVISGQVSTNRLILRFEGNRLDLSDFLADKVIAREDNLVIIQFSSEEDARSCLRELSGMDNIIFAEMDEYTILEDAEISEKSDDIIPKDISAPCYSWGTADMGMDQLSAYVARTYPDRSVLVAVVDSGALIGREFSDRASTYSVMTGGEAVPEEHGTHTTGIVLDGTRGTGVKVLNIDYGTGAAPGKTISSVELAYRYAADAGAQVISMSLGWTGHHSATIEDAVTRAVESGIVVVKSAGNKSDSNDGTGDFSCPGELTAPIVVAAYNKNHEIAYFSNYGSTVDVAGPGMEIYSQYYKDENRLISLQGTSMAAPHVAALAALVKMIYPDATPAQVEMYIKDYGRGEWDPAIYGAGSPDATGFIEP